MPLYYNWIQIINNNMVMINDNPDNNKIMKERILEALGNLGFKLKEENDGTSYGFSYEGLNLLYMYNENDEDFLNISLPGILEVEEDKFLQTCALLEKINSTLKYVKAYILGGDVWMFYERELLGGEDLMIVISRMILHLEAGLKFARKAMKEIEESVRSSSSEDGEGNIEEIESQETDEGNDNNENGGL